jgi:hypothetical protein
VFFTFFFLCKGTLAPPGRDTVLTVANYAISVFFPRVPPDPVHYMSISKVFINGNIYTAIGLQMGGFFFFFFK